MGERFGFGDTTSNGVFFPLMIFEGKITVRACYEMLSHKSDFFFPVTDRDLCVAL